MLLAGYLPFCWFLLPLCQSCWPEILLFCMTPAMRDNPLHYWSHNLSLPRILEASVRLMLELHPSLTAGSPPCLDSTRLEAFRRVTWSSHVLVAPNSLISLLTEGKLGLKLKIKMAAVGLRNRRVLKLLLNPWFRRSKVKRFVTAGKFHKPIIIIINLLRETKNRGLCYEVWPALPGRGVPCGMDRDARRLA